MFNRAFRQVVPSELIKCWPTLSEQDRKVWNQLALFVTAHADEEPEPFYLYHNFLEPLKKYPEKTKLAIETIGYFNIAINGGDRAQYFKDAETFLTNRDLQQKIASAELKELVIFCTTKNRKEFLFRIAFWIERESFLQHIYNMPQDTAEQVKLKKIKQDVLEEVNVIFSGARESTDKQQLKKIRLVTRVMTATANDVINADDYHYLMTEVSKHGWGKNLASIMTKVIPIALFAACAALMITTGGLAAPAILGLGAVTALIIAASATGGASLGFAGVAVFAMWQQQKKNNVEGKLMDVIKASPVTRRTVG